MVAAWTLRKAGFGMRVGMDEFRPVIERLGIPGFTGVPGEGRSFMTFRTLTETVTRMERQGTDLPTLRRFLEDAPATTAEEMDTFAGDMVWAEPDRIVVDGTAPETGMVDDPVLDGICRLHGVRLPMPPVGMEAAWRHSTYAGPPAPCTLYEGLPDALPPMMVRNVPGDMHWCAHYGPVHYMRYGDHGEITTEVDVAETVMSALVGRPLSELVGIPGADRLLIAGSHRQDGWTRIELDIPKETPCSR